MQNEKLTKAQSDRYELNRLCREAVEILRSAGIIGDEDQDIELRLQKHIASATCNWTDNEVNIALKMIRKERLGPWSCQQ